MGYSWALTSIASGIRELVHTATEVKKRKLKIPKKIFLIGRGKLGKEKGQRVDELLDKYAGLKGFHLAEEKIGNPTRRRAI